MEDAQLQNRHMCHRAQDADGVPHCTPMASIAQCKRTIAQISAVVDRVWRFVVFSAAAVLGHI
eukprot:scaffold293776_cov21-Tisochrysis_lutea.AAC.1